MGSGNFCRSRSLNQVVRGMKPIVKGLILAAFLAGVFAAFMAIPAMALSARSDTSYAATDIDSAIISGRPGDGFENGETAAGRLWLTYFRTAGTKTSAQAQSTQLDTYLSDT